MHSSTLFIKVIILNINGIGCFDSPRGPKQCGNGFSGTPRYQATCHNRKMHVFVRFWRGFACFRVFKGEIGDELLSLSTKVLGLDPYLAPIHCNPANTAGTAAVKSLLTVMALLQQKPWSERCAQCKWR